MAAALTNHRISELERRVGSLERQIVNLITARAGRAQTAQLSADSGYITHHPIGGGRPIKTKVFRRPTPASAPQGRP